LVDSPGLPALVESVEPGSAAERAGMKAGQEIVRIHSGNIDVRVETVREAQDALLSISGMGRRVSVFTADKRALPKRWALPQRPERSLPVHPAQLYSSIDALLLCLFLLAWYPYRRRDGEVLALLVTLHPVSRFLLEIVRTDESAVFGTGLSISQNLSLAMLAGAAVLWWIVLNRPRHLEWIPQVRHA
jgi:phosphatidylglycerol:prolipoprotein diacylglycerol transferase